MERTPTSFTVPTTAPMSYTAYEWMYDWASEWDWMLNKGTEMLVCITNAAWGTSEKVRNWACMAKDVMQEGASTIVEHKDLVCYAIVILVMVVYVFFRCKNNDTDTEEKANNQADAVSVSNADAGLLTRAESPEPEVTDDELRRLTTQDLEGLLRNQADAVSVSNADAGLLTRAESPEPEVTDDELRRLTTQDLEGLQEAERLHIERLIMSGLLRNDNDSNDSKSESSFGSAFDDIREWKGF